MEIKVTTSENKKIPLLSKISLILFGIFLTSLIFALCVDSFNETGIWTGLLISIILIFCGFYYIKKGTRLRLITWSMLVTVIIGGTIYGIGLLFLFNSLKDL